VFHVQNMLPFSSGLGTDQHTFCLISKKAPMGDKVHSLLRLGIPCLFCGCPDRWRSYGDMLDKHRFAAKGLRPTSTCLCYDYHVVKLPIFPTTLAPRVHGKTAPAHMLLPGFSWGTCLIPMNAQHPRCSFYFKLRVGGDSGEWSISFMLPCIVCPAQP